MKCLYLIIGTVILTTVSFAQSLDSLKLVAGNQVGLEKVTTLRELSYQYLQTNLDSSIAYGRKALALAERLGNPQAIADSKSDLTLGLVYSGAYQEVRVLAQEMLDYRFAVGDTIGIAKAYSRLAIVEYETGNFSESIRLNLEAAEIFARKGAVYFAAQIRNNIANSYAATGQELEAIAQLKLAYRVFDSYSDSSKLVVAASNIAYSFYQVNELDSAIHWIELAERYVQASNLGPQTLFLQTKATILKTKGLYEEAKETYFKMHYLGEKMQNNLGLPVMAKGIGDIYRIQGQLDSADYWANRGLAEAEDELMKESELLNLKVQIKLEKGELDSAQHYLGLFETTNQKLTEERTKENIGRWQVKYETEKQARVLNQREKDLEQAQAKILQRNRWLIGFLILALLVAGLTIQWIQQIQLKRKKDQLAAEVQRSNERLKLSRDLHDHLGAEVTMIASKLDLMALETAGEGNRAKLTELAQQSRSAMTSLREAIWSVNEPNLNLEDLVERLHDFSTKGGVTFTVITETISNHQLLPTFALDLYRSGQEIITNASKYAREKALQLTIHETKNELRFLWENETSEQYLDKESSGQLGLKNIEERLKFWEAYVHAQAEETTFSIQMSIPKHAIIRT